MVKTQTIRLNINFHEKKKVVSYNNNYVKPVNKKQFELLIRKMLYKLRKLVYLIEYGIVKNPTI